jgi:hypothetical protein
MHIAIDQIYRYRHTQTSDLLPQATPPDVKHHTSVKMAPGMSLYSVNAIIILSTDDGARIFSKYYAPPHHGAGTCRQLLPAGTQLGLDLMLTMMGAQPRMDHTVT